MRTSENTTTNEEIPRTPNGADVWAYNPDGSRRHTLADALEMMSRPVAGKKRRKRRFRGFDKARRWKSPDEAFAAYEQEDREEHRKAQLRTLSRALREVARLRGAARGREARTCAVRSGGRLVSATVSTGTGTDSGDSPPGPSSADGDDEGSSWAGLGPALTSFAGGGNAR